MNPSVEIRDPKLAFNEAIERGVLSSRWSSPNYAGRYMYMYSTNGFDYFKHKLNRTYIKTESTK